MSDLRFSLVIPCYNEALSLPDLIAKAKFVAAQGDGEVILVDNGSTDSTPSVLNQLLPRERVRSIRVEVNKGYGHGILAGLDEAKAPIIGWTHADLQTDPADVLRVLAQMESVDGPVLAKGRRFGRPIGDRIFTAGMSVFESILLFAKLSDINAQPTLFSRSLITSWGTPPEDFALDLFALYTARKLHFTIIRFPVIFAPRKFGQSSWNVDMRAKRKFISRTMRYSLALRRRL